MTKFNYDLNGYDPNICSLTPDQIQLYFVYFEFISTNCDRIPTKIYEDMTSIEVQFNDTQRLSPAQMKYVEDIYDRYCNK
jgi:deoxyadenosine/deoxycytidine kinase